MKDGFPGEAGSELSFERQVVGTQPSTNQRPLLPIIPGDCFNKVELICWLCLMRSHAVSSAETIAEEFNSLLGGFSESGAGSVF